LLAAISEANAKNFSMSPRGADSAARDYQATVNLWTSRVEPALNYWVNEEKLSPDTAAYLRSLSPFEQVAEVLKLEADGLFFAKDLSKSIIYSVAPAGASQHLSMLAFDVSEFGEPTVREILEKHGWFQTVVSDLPHFTYLGVEERELAGLGLKPVDSCGQKFWTPDI
ncbi:MAG: hypothetical protein LC730_02615, partial [Acidobacteria bacterium]|nr:hypothetical protein [Acidobacteriota bacterium]